MAEPTPDRLDRLRLSFGRWLVILAWGMLPVCLGVALAAGGGVAPAAGAAVLLAGAATAARLARPDGSAARCAAGACLASAAAIPAWLLSGTPWAAAGDAGPVVAVACVAVCGEAAVLLVTGAVALLALGAVVLQGGGGLPVLHGTMLAAETGGLTWVAHQLQRVADDSRAALAAAAEAAVQTELAMRLTSETASDLAGLATEDRLARQFEHDIGKLVGDAAQAADAVRGAVLRISGVAAQTAEQTMAIADASRDTSASAQDVARSVEQLAASVTKVTQEIREVSDASFKAMEDAGSTNVTVQHLADAASSIGDIVRVIRGIATQTNLLALNAAIEAARAGEAGKGFSVVAGEVKALAQQTARATGEIEAQINTIQTEMTSAMAAIDGIATTVAHLGGITVSVAGSMEEHASFTREITHSAMRAAASTAAVVSNLRGLTDGAGRSSEAAREGFAEAERLVGKCQGVDTAVQSFVQALL